MDFRSRGTRRDPVVLVYWATDTRDAFELDTVVSSELDDDLMDCVKNGGFFMGSDAPAAMLPIASSWVGAALPACSSLLCRDDGN